MPNLVMINANFLVNLDCVISAGRDAGGVVTIELAGRAGRDDGSDTVQLEPGGEADAVWAKLTAAARAGGAAGEKEDGPAGRAVGP